mmetsp:Transcript_20600/g.31434  ORF Transcript_20600/g.31434 Transcript_20600/m.31434 type:complete len:126 (+) Transcript_20600:432-809(+)
MEGLERYWGYSMDEVVGALGGLKESLVGHDVALVAHDWGAAAALSFIDKFKQDACDRVVLLDGGLFRWERGARESFLILAYRAYLGLCFFISRILGWFYLDELALLLFVLYPWQWFGPVPKQGVS